MWGALVLKRSQDALHDPIALGLTDPRRAGANPQPAQLVGKQASSGFTRPPQEDCRLPLDDRRSPQADGDSRGMLTLAVGRLTIAVGS